MRVSAVRRQEWVTPTHLIKNCMMAVFLKIDLWWPTVRVRTVLYWMDSTQPKISSNVSVSIPHMSVISLISVLKQ